jgi:hypothetical protein
MHDVLSSAGFVSIIGVNFQRVNLRGRISVKNLQKTAVWACGSFGFSVGAI